MIAPLALALPASAPAEHSSVELITTGPVQGGDGALRGPLFASPDGRRVLFHVSGNLAPADVDRCEDPDTGEVFSCLDGYERFDGVTSLVTTGPLDPQNGPMEIAAASKDASRAFFGASGLTPGDPNRGIYERAAGITTLLASAEPLDGGSGPFLLGVSEDGEHVFFSTTNRLVPEDTDDCEDYYESFGGTIRLVTTGVAPIAVPYGPQCASLTRFAISADGERFFARTNSTITRDDLDPGNGTAGSIGEDIYEWSREGVRLITTGPADVPDSGYIEAGAISRDGRRVVFLTREPLVAEDTDAEQDLYVRFDGETNLVAPSLGGDVPKIFGQVSADGTQVITSTFLRLSPADTDGQEDVYAISDRSARLLSTGSSGGDGDCPPSELCSQFWASAAGGSEDARVVLFTTGERLVPEDIDNARDLYASVNGMTHLVSTGTNDGPGRSFGADTFRGLMVSADGSRVFFVTDDPLAIEDTDTLDDVYEWHAGRSTVVPRGVPSTERVLLVVPHQFVGDGSRVFLHTTSQLTANDTDSDLDVYGVGLNAAPNCDDVVATPAVLQPANGRLVPIALGGVTDPNGDDISIDVTHITQDETTGRTRDAVLTSAGDELRLRAERDNRGDGRVYRIDFEATDGNGGSCSGTTPVSAPRKKHRAAVDSAPPSYDSRG